MAIVAIATGQGIGATNRTLVVAMHMDQLYNMTAKKTVLHVLTVAYPASVFCIIQEISIIAEAEI